MKEKTSNIAEKKPAADFEFYQKDGENYCKFNLGKTVIDAPINEIYNVAAGLGFAVLIVFLIARQQFLKP